MSNSIGAKNQGIPRVAPGSPPKDQHDKDRQAVLADWALPFLHRDIAHLLVLRSAIEVLNRPADRPVQTPKMRDHLQLAHIHLTNALDEAETLLRNTERFIAAGHADAAAFVLGGRPS
jgi:hypothetical protein